MFKTHSVKKYSYTCVEVIFESYLKRHTSLDFLARLLFGRLGLGNKNQFLKKRQERDPRMEVMQLFFVCYQPKLYKILLLPQPDVACS